MATSQSVYYRIDDSDNPGWALAEILEESGHNAAGKLFKIRILSILKPSTFVRLKPNTVKPRVTEKLLFKDKPAV